MFEWIDDYESQSWTEQGEFIFMEEESNNPLDLFMEPVKIIFEEGEELWTLIHK